MEGVSHVLSLAAEESVEDEREYAADGDVVAEARDLEREGLSLRQREEYAWQEAWRFYNGKHWSTWLPDGRMVDIESSKGVPHIVLNFILSMVQTKLGHLIKNKPILQGLPANTQEDARNATKLAVQVIHAYWRKLSMARKLSEALLWTLVCGKCFWKVWWDPKAGKSIERPGPLVPVMGEDGQPMIHPMTGEPIRSEGPPVVTREGDLCVEVAYPHEIMVDPGAQDLSKATRLLHTTYVPIGKIKDDYGLSDEEVAALQNSDVSDDSSYRARLQLEGLENVSGVDMKGRAPVRELWVRPNEKYPQGLWAVIINGKVKKKEPLPSDYMTNVFPFVEFDEIKTNSFWSTSTARQLLDINRVINTEISQQENVRKTLRYKTLVPEQSNIDKDQFDDTDDEVITYWAPYAPSHLQPPDLPSHHVEIRNSLITMVKELGGNWDVMAGKTSGEVRSGRQTAYLQEYAGTVLGVVAEQIGEAIVGAANKMLVLLQERVEEPRLESIVGTDKRIQVIAFKGADLKGCSEIVLQPGSAIPLSRTERWDRIEHWMEMGWLDPKLGIRMLDLGNVDQDIYQEEELDRMNADEIIWKVTALSEEQLKEAYPRSQQMAMLEGNMWSVRYLLKALDIEAFPFDNHEIHIKMYDGACRKTRTYKDFNKVKRVLMDSLVEWHAMLADPQHGPIESSLDGTIQAQGGALIPPGSNVAAASAPQGKGPGQPQPPTATGSPQAMQGKRAPGMGGIGQNPNEPGYIPESGAEAAEGLPGVPRPPGPGRGTPY